MHYELQWARRAQEDLRALDPGVARRIIEKVQTYAQTSDPMRFAKPLVGTFRGKFRFRIGDYRAIFRRDNNGTLHVLIVLQVAHRREVYE